MSIQTASPDQARGALLGPDDPLPVGVVNADAGSRFLIICDHAGNDVPAALGDLGLPASELGRHIGIDIGALGVAMGLARRLSAPLVWQRYSRLVIDCNRKLAAPASMSEVADGTTVPGNAGLSQAARSARVSEILEPYHDTITRRLDARKSAGLPTILVAVHSFTPRLRARPADRPWHIGLCWAENDAFSRHVLTALSEEKGLADLVQGPPVLGENEPYTVDMINDYSIPVHGEGRGLPYAELEIRQDLIKEPSRQEAFADMLARVMNTAADSFNQTTDASS